MLMLGEVGQRRTKIDETVDDEIYLGDRVGDAGRGVAGIPVKNMTL